jgi:sugar transferase (PEP-CTERM/EpsH1 system associated)
MSTPQPPLVVHVLFRFAIGGLENGVVNLINRLPHREWRHAVVSLTDVDPAFAQRVTRPDVTYVSLAKGAGHLLRHYPRLLKLFRDLRPAIVHTRNLAALEAVVPAWAARVPARVHGEHGRDVNDLDGTRRRYQWVRRAYRPFVTRYVALAPDLERYLEERIGIPSDRIDQIYNGVDTDRFLPPPSPRKPVLGCPFGDGEHWVVGTVGRMDTVKDQTNLARAFVAALQIHPEARRKLRLVMVGDGALRAAAESILARANASDLAWFAGERTDVVSLMQSFDCFALPSLAEGVSNTILEAMATQLPVIATRVGANAELVEPGMTGLVVPAADSVALANAIVSYFSDPALARRHGRAGRQRVEQRFSLDRMIENYHRLYTGLLPERAAQRGLAAPTLPRDRHV